MQDRFKVRVWNTLVKKFSYFDKPEMQIGTDGFDSGLIFPLLENSNLYMGKCLEPQFCTGLKDKNGKLIWENDIIKKDFYTDYDAYVNSEAYTGRIQYEDGGWSVERTMSNGSICTSPIIDMIAYSKDIEQFEVIGNIFDNPELLNKREETCCKDGNDYER